MDFTFMQFYNSWGTALSTNLFLMHCYHGIKDKAKCIRRPNHSLNTIVFFFSLSLQAIQIYEKITQRFQQTHLIDNLIQSDSGIDVSFISFAKPPSSSVRGKRRIISPAWFVHLIYVIYSTAAAMKPTRLQSPAYSALHIVCTALVRRCFFTAFHLWKQKSPRVALMQQTMHHRPEKNRIKIL